MLLFSSLSTKAAKEKRSIWVVNDLEGFGNISFQVCIIAANLEWRV